MMTNEHAGRGSGVEHTLVRDYLEELRAEAARLPAAQAHELYADIREHIHAALPENPSEDQVHEQLRRTGSPTQLVQESGGPPAPAPASAPAPAGGPSETRRGLLVGAVIALVAAEVAFFLVPIAGLAWVAGLIMLGIAPTHTTRLKLRGFLAVGTGFPMMLMMGMLTFGVVGGVSTSCAGSSTRVGDHIVTQPEVCTSTGPGPWVPITIGVLFLAYLVWQALTVRALLRRRG